MIKKVHSLILVAALFQAVIANAQGSVFEKEVADETASGRTFKVDFRANVESPELGRAWLFGYYDQRYLEDSQGPIPHAIDITVPGLSYSPESKQIIFKKSDGSKVVCAENVAASSGHGISYTETGKCNIELSKTMMSQDSGFYIKKTKAIKITLNLHE